jgi:uncharacterized membrane protein
MPSADNERGTELLNEAFEGLEQQAPDRLTRLIRWLRDPKSRKIRIPLGILFILASFLWFLPVLGLELLPIGLLLIAQDVPFLRAPVAKMMLWLERKWAEQRRVLVRKGAWSGYLLGFALSGFFDGILLHQILQWHHLLLGVQSDPFQDMRVQILADGLFHVLMYLIAIAGIWSLWRGRHSPDLITGRKVLSHMLIGFGVWHVLDAFVSHWFLGIHRIKMDSPNPLLWDLLWFTVFGVIPLIVGSLLSRTSKHREAHSGRAARAALVLAVSIAGPLAALPPSDNDQVLVLVRPSSANQLLGGLHEVRGGIMWADRSAALWVFSIGEHADAQRFYDHGAIFVTRSPAVLGCVAWTRSLAASP